MHRIRLFPDCRINVPGMSTSPDQLREARPLRADALRNRERILDTARRLFAERGLGVTLNDVAHEAGVGVGTVYRRFPDKTTLIDALLSAKFDALSMLARRAAACPTARQAMREYLFGAVELRAGDRALAEVIVRAHTTSDTVRGQRDRLEEQVGALIEWAEQEGVLRAGFAARDVPMLVVMVGAVADRTSGCGSEVWRRYAQIVVDGVCPPVVEERLTGHALGRAELERAFADD
jgi:AcrR family transcriptional regulator